MPLDIVIKHLARSLLERREAHFNFMNGRGKQYVANNDKSLTAFAISISLGFDGKYSSETSLGQSSSI